ncbi:hypothetical protein T06_7228 [Trichinella sp. T6]|nr:hypothetical protein T06_7228 [Trichinella sp. T6]
MCLRRTPGRIGMTEELYRASDALQAELEQDLEREERQCAIDDWARVAGCGRTQHMLLHPSTLSEPVRSTEPISEQRGVFVSRLCKRSLTS